MIMRELLRPLFGMLIVAFAVFAASCHDGNRAGQNVKSLDISTVVSAMMERFYRFGQSIDATEETAGKPELDDELRIVQAALQLAFFEGPTAETVLLETAFSAADDKQRRSYAESYLN